ncbi:hypothetical protein FXN63_22635 [Pigmentiphaga aceris]|uniref:Uncharacterized protein n=1 Tax=Pigmentiphaga aceris TaxID=1940612 RepID=A0A5C0B0Q3_9BURK|nr:hypothetical protein [Pigmentiphaga aceris]QEI08319.1 hypothetical protein FXN63_22635 [Pigmentiphaga aceris]
MSRKDFSRTDSKLQLGSISKNSNENFLGTIEKENYQGFRVYEEMKNHGRKFYVKEEFPTTVIVYPPDGPPGMRIFREVPPDMEVDYVARKSDFSRIEKIDQVINYFINSYCRSEE